MKSALGKTEIAWNALFDKYDIVKRVGKYGRFRISADKIRAFREPRLMAKFDHRKNLPEAFRDSGFGILPVSRGDYLIGPFKLFATHPKLDDTVPISHVSLPSAVESISPDSITSEAVALNCAWDSRILHDFLGEDNLYPTHSGRMGSNKFSFRIQDEEGGRTSSVMVNGAQIEIDAAYEGAGSVTIIEAKMDLAEDFIVRQLYYPYRHFSSLALSKPVRTLYVTYSGGVFYLTEYAFEDRTNYNSVSLVKSGRYAIGCPVLSIAQLQEMLDATAVEAEPDDIPFPQADTFARVQNLCERLATGPMSKEDIEECYGFDIRQADYYYNAAAYLGLAGREGGRGTKVVLTSKGREWAKLPVSRRNLYMVRRMLCHEPFRQVLRLTLLRRAVPDKSEIRDVLLRTNPGIGDVRKNTYNRRASTVRLWTQWIMSLVGG
ncbi:MAG: transcriptional regulator [Kiritimatiellae bacterium]|nr:transcriptional regulator [Kiritimatiellia bacterium]